MSTTYSKPMGGTAANGLRKITGVFKEENGKGFDVRVNDEIKAALSSISVGEYLKVYQNESKEGKPYLSICVKSLSKNS